MRTFAIFMALAACSAEPGAGNHSPQQSGGGSPRPFVDRSGLAAPRDDGSGGAADEEVAVAKQALTNCVEPLPYRRRLTNIVVTSNVPSIPSVCPAAWYVSTDPFQWREGYARNLPQPPSVPPGVSCQVTYEEWPFHLGPSTRDSCRIWTTFTCPNGIAYSAVVQAGNPNPAGDPWALAIAEVRAQSIDGSCVRTIRANFNVVGP